jgi:endonuclease/exonuclease/phosphatase family metal-dependent hydrolase
MQKQLYRLNFTTFNILCPSYRVLEHLGQEERHHPFVVEFRKQKMIEFLRTSVPRDYLSGIIFLQELWFDRRDYMDELLSVFSGEVVDFHHSSFNQRHKKPDGIGILVPKDEYDVKSTRQVTFPRGNRVALLASLVHKASRTPLLIGTLHLTFPHNERSRGIQLEQAACFLEELDAFEREERERLQEGTRREGLVVVAGDFNGELSSDQLQLFLQSGFRSSLQEHFKQRRRREEEEEEKREQEEEEREFPFISHLAHTGAEVGVDHILFKPLHLSSASSSSSSSSSIQLLESVLHPSHLSPTVPFRESMALVETLEEGGEEFDGLISDHRPLSTSFVLEFEE